MSEKKKKDIPQEQPKPEETTPETPVEETPQVPEVEETFTVTRQQMEQFESLAKLLSDGNDKYLRLAAEYDNYRKRTTKEKESIYADAKLDTVKPFLDVADNLDRAVTQFEEGDPHRQGMELICKQFAAVLEKLGVTEIEALGQPFDPEKHNAVMHVEDEEAGENTVVEVFQKGFMLGDKVLPGMKVRVDGREAVVKTKKVYIALNKPAGVVCTADPREPMNVVDYVGHPERIFPIGRLDKDSEGLLLMTNDGEIVNRILRAAGGHEKEYVVTVNKVITDDFLRQMAEGVPILDTVTLPCRVRRTGERSFNIVLVQGLNRQIRRMCEALGYRVTRLRRVRIIGLHRFLQQNAPAVQNFIHKMHRCARHLHARRKSGFVYLKPVHARSAEGGY